MRPINHIIIHCTATPADWWGKAKTSAKVAEVRRWHKEQRGWSDIGYHYLIDRDGTVVNGRPIERTGAHVQGHNTGSIGISLFGGHGSSADDQFDENFTSEQEAALLKLIDDLRRWFPAIARVSGHNEFAAKACPGFRVKPWYEAHTKAPAAQPAPKREIGGGNIFSKLFGGK